VDVSIIIVSFNTRELTLACLGSVYEQTRGVQFEVIVVDNASEDGSAQAIRAAFKSVQLIALDQNVGFAKANNLAALGSSADYLLLLNPDTVLLDGAVQRAIMFARSQPGVGVVGGRTFFGDMRLNRNSCHGRPTAWSMFCMGTGLSSLMRQSAWFNPESLGSWQRDTVRKVDAVTGCFLLIDRRLWVKLQGFDESFFMYGEDTDLCIRTWQVGLKCMVCPEARLIHFGGKSEKVRADKMVKLFRAKSQLIRKHWPPQTQWFGVAMLQLWAMTRMLACGTIGMARPMTRGSATQWRAVWDRRDQFSKI
jgi:N-acetylglucosaminyl-diphospho-decaprenol L-rhamnosyltransferase